MTTNIRKAVLTKLKEHTPGLIVIVTLTILVCRNLFSPDFPAGVDMLGHIAEISAATEGLYVWIYRHVSVGLHTLGLLLSVLNLFLKNTVLVVKLSIFTIFLLSGLSMYFFAYHYSKKKVASIFSSIIFMINQWYISQWASGHLLQTFAYAMLPLLFFSFDKALKSGKAKSIIIFSAVLSLIILCRLDFLAFCAPFLMLYALFVVIIPYDTMKRKIVSIHIIKVLLIGGVIVFLFSAFQFIPILLGAPLGYVSYYLEAGFPIEDFIEWSFGFFESLLGLAREISYLYYVFRIRFDSHPFLTLFQYRMIMAIPVILAFSAIIFRRDRQTLFFTSSALISIFLAKGLHWPFGEANSWLYFNIPFFSLLHVPNRWLMITYLSYSFLAGITVNAIYTKLQELKGFRLSVLTGSHGSYRVTLRPLSHIFIVIMMIPLFFPSWYIVSDGFQTWRPPEEYVQPYLWIAEQPGDFRVATVPYCQTYLFAGWGGKRLWEQDLGYVSSIFHGRPVVRIGGGNPYEQGFIDYTYGLVLADGTDNLMKILGAFNVKYLVVEGYQPIFSLPQGYDPDYQHRFFSRQKGLRQVYIYGSSTVYENEFWIQHVFAALTYAIVVGGREAFTALTTVDNFNLSDWCLLFADQMVIDQSNVDSLTQLLSESPLLIFVNSELLDLAMLTLKNAITIEAVDYAYPSTDRLHHWISDNLCIVTGATALNRRLLSTSGEVSVSIPISVKTSGQYEVWIRILHSPDRGHLGIAMDGKAIGGVVPSAWHNSGLKWIKIGSTWLDQGKHDLALMNSGGRNDIDEILLVNPQELESAIRQVTEVIQQSSARVIHIIEGEQLSKWVSTNFYNWWPEKWPFDASNGYLVSTQAHDREVAAWMSLNYYILKSGAYSLALRVAAGPSYGNLDVVIDKIFKYSINCSNPETVFKWITVDPLTLQSGEHTFDLHAKGDVKIDQMAIYSLNQYGDGNTIGDIFKTNKQQTIVSYEMINPTKYVVHVKADSPFFLMFSEAYHSLWRAYIDGGEEVKPTLIDSFINGFYIAKTGEYDMTIEFIGQRYLTYGSIISAASVTFTMVYFIFSVKINQFITKKLKLKKKKGNRK